jgi:hypothetical protein
MLRGSVCRLLQARLILLFVISLLIIMPIVHGDGQFKDLCLDMTTAYDRNFKWYNTAGPLPSFNGNHYVFTGSSASNVYQDALSLKTIEAGKTFVLSARISVYIGSQSQNDRDEFAIFVTDDTRVFTGDEFGFVIRQKSSTINGYVQSPRIPEFFKEFKLEKIPIGAEKAYTLKAVYSEVNNRGVIRFFINDINVFTQDFPIISGEEFYLVISSKKLSSESVDTSSNYMKVFSACMINLPPQRADTAAQETFPRNESQSMEQMMLMVLTLNSAVLIILAIALLVLIRRLRKLGT